MVESVEMVVRLLGPTAVTRAGAVVALPRSRKVRALLAFLALSPRPVHRSTLCDLLWDVPNDPRGELRWCLSKLRAVLDDDRRRVVTSDDLVSLDLSDCRVDALDVEAALRAGLDALSITRLDELHQLFAGDLLEGVDVDGSPELTGWLSSQRNRYRLMHVDILHALATRATTIDDTLRWIDRWLQVAPFDVRAHELMLATLARAGRVHDAETHLTGAIRAFEDAGVDWIPLRTAWDAVRRPRIDMPATPVAGDARTRRRASVAVMPFVERGSVPGVADGMTEDIIMQLAKLRVLFVIARGSTFALDARGVDAQDAGRLLDVDYVVTGSVRRNGDRLVTKVELVDVRDRTIVWTDDLEASGQDAFAMLDSIVQRIVAAIAEEIETAESRRAILKSPSSLDAWEAYHRGLWHMYKFTGDDNRHAEQLFRSAIQLDPTFARAFAGLSFTHFQNAFLDLTQDRQRQIDLAFETAHASLGADDADPAAHWAMGRALWLRGEQRESLAELERSVELSPNFALGHYTLGFVLSQRGDPQAAIAATTYSRQLSPFDPLQFAMLASRALAHVRLGQRDEAAAWAVKATARPNAHAHILAIAAECLLLVDRRDEARKFVAQIRGRLPAYCVEDFLRAFQFDADVEHMFRRNARVIGF